MNQSVQSLRPSGLRVLQRAATCTVRCSTLCALATVLIADPVLRWLFQAPLLQRMRIEYQFVFVFGLLCHTLPWLLLNGTFMFMESIQPYNGSGGLRSFGPLAALGDYLSRYKLPRKPFQLPTMQLKMRTVLRAFIDQCIVAPIVFYATISYVGASVVPSPYKRVPAMAAASEQGGWLPRISTGLLPLIPHFAIALLVNEVLFYVAHASLHAHPFLYRTFHKQHHEYIGTVSIAAEYATGVETLLAATIPTIAYFLLMFTCFPDNYPSAFVQTARCWPLFMTWMWARLWETYETHSGFCFEGSWLGRMGLLHGRRARFHDYHHTHNTGNYGTGIFMDAMCHTMDAYLKYRKLPGGKRD